MPPRRRASTGRRDSTAPIAGRRSCSVPGGPSEVAACSRRPLTWVAEHAQRPTGAMPAVGHFKPHDSPEDSLATRPLAEWVDRECSRGTGYEVTASLAARGGAAWPGPLTGGVSRGWPPCSRGGPFRSGAFGKGDRGGRPRALCGKRRDGSTRIPNCLENRDTVEGGSRRTRVDLGRDPQPAAACSRAAESWSSWHTPRGVLPSPVSRPPAPSDSGYGRSLDTYQAASSGGLWPRRLGRRQAAFQPESAWTPARGQQEVAFPGPALYADDREPSCSPGTFRLRPERLTVHTRLRRPEYPRVWSRKSLPRPNLR